MHIYKLRVNIPLGMKTIIATLQVTANLDALIKVRKFIEETAVTHINDQQTISDIVLAVDEAVTNIIRHGYQQQPGKIEISLSYRQNRIEIKLCDWSPNFDPTQVTSPNPDTPLAQRKPGGMGVHMIRYLTDDLKYEKLPDGCNQLTLIKQI